MRCCKTLPRCPAQRPLQLSLGKLRDICFLVVPSYIAGETLRPPPRPLPLLIVERFHFMHFIRSLTRSFFLPSFWHFHFPFMWFSCLFDCFFWSLLRIDYCSSLCTFGSVYFFFLITLKYVYLLIHFCVFVDPPPVTMEYCSSLCTFGSVYFCCFLNTLKYMYLLIHFFVDPPLVTIEYCSSLCTLGCVYFFKIHFCFFLDPLKYIYVLIHFYLYLIPRPLWTARPEGP